MRPVFVLCLSFALSCGCAHKALVTTWQPAEIAVSGLHEIAVLGFQGPRGDAVSAQLSRDLATGEFYSLIDPLKLSSDVHPASFSAARQAPLKDLCQAARERGVEGILSGEVLEYRCAEREVSRLEWMRQSDVEPAAPAGPLDRFKVRHRSKLLREATVSVAFRLIEVDSGDSVAERTVTRSRAALLDVSEAEASAAEDLLDGLLQECVKEIVALLAPHEAAGEIELARGEGGWLSRWQVRQGLALAEEGDWTAAEEKWESALKLNPRNHAAVYNMAVSAARQQNFRRAEEFALRALRMQHRDIYARGLETIRALRTALERSQDQQDARILTSGQIAK